MIKLFFFLIVFAITILFATLFYVSSFSLKVLLPTNQTKSNNKLRLFCIILTEKKSLDFKAPVAVEAWAHKCQDYRFLTLLPDDLNQSIVENKHEVQHKYNLARLRYDSTAKIYTQKLTHIKLLQPPGLVNDTYAKITDKIYLAFKYIYNEHRKADNQFDWYLKCDE
jgi:hypothetical protein